MTLKELEKYCIQQGIKCVGKSVEAETYGSNRYYAGQASVFMLIAGCIQNDNFGVERPEDECPEEQKEEPRTYPTFASRLSKALEDYWHDTYAAFARVCGITMEDMNSYLFDGVMPDNQTIEKMAKVMNAPSGFLFGGKE